MVEWRPFRCESVIGSLPNTRLVLDGVDECPVDLHSRGLVHGDIKPDNVLLLKSGVTLIDSFDVEAGAPEQVRGEQVHPAADVYPPAVMAVQVLGGESVGEVRKYRTPRGTTMPGEVDPFHSPSLYVADGLTGAGLSAWRRLIERSLSLDPERRPSTAEFATGLRGPWPESCRPPDEAERPPDAKISHPFAGNGRALR
ncbi:protein kinase family protein [Saccharothrix stipae]